MNPYATIRSALELADRVDSCHATGGEQIAKDATIRDALTALAELERAASEPVAYQYAHPYFGRGTVWREERHWNGHTSDESRALYAAPPIPKGMFTAEEMEAAFDDGARSECWIGSDTIKLVESRK